MNDKEAPTPAPGAPAPGMPRIKWKYEVIYVDNGDGTSQVMVNGFSKDQALATFMHIWAWEIIKDWFKGKAKAVEGEGGRITVTPRMPRVS